MCLIPLVFCSWGFFGHQQVNKMAVFTLPPGMIRFYKANTDYLVASAVNPDKRRYAIPEEGPRHYIDLDEYETDLTAMPERWSEAVDLFGEEALMHRGIVPWHAFRMYLQLRDAMLVGDPSRILRISSELGHYVADAHVPLHTTSNHNGQKTDQHGIHGLWESRLPELFSNHYNEWVGPAKYIEDPQHAMWLVVQQSHACVDSVLRFESELSKKNLATKYAFETRGKQTTKVYAYRYARTYHDLLSGMVERRWRASILMVGSVWYSAWVDAGQPNLDRLVNYQPTEEELEERRREIESWKVKRVEARDEDTKDD